MKTLLSFVVSLVVLVSQVQAQVADEVYALADKKGPVDITSVFQVVKERHPDVWSKMLSAWMDSSFSGSDRRDIAKFLIKEQGDKAPPLAHATVGEKFLIDTYGQPGTDPGKINLVFWAHPEQAKLDKAAKYKAEITVQTKAKDVVVTSKSKSVDLVPTAEARSLSVVFNDDTQDKAMVFKPPQIVFISMLLTAYDKDDKPIGDVARTVAWQAKHGEDGVITYAHLASNGSAPYAQSAELMQSWAELRDMLAAKNGDQQADEGAAPDASVSTFADLKGAVAPVVTIRAWKPDSLADIVGEAGPLRWKKDRVYVLDFWALWCGPCKKALPGIGKLNDDYKDRNVEVLSLCLGGEPRDYGGQTDADYTSLASYIKDVRDKGVTQKIGVVEKGVLKDWRLRGIPAVAVIYNEKVVFVQTGIDGDSDKLLRAEIDKIAAKPTAK